jgi:hypothetical protein
MNSRSWRRKDIFAVSLFAVVGVGILINENRKRADGVKKSDNSRPSMESKVKSFVNKRIKDVINEFKSGGVSNIILIEEPPLVIRGIAVYKQNCGVLDLYLRKDDPNYRRFNAERIGHNELDDSVVGGVVFRAVNEEEFQAGELPWFATLNSKETVARRSGDVR